MTEGKLGSAHRAISLEYQIHPPTIDTPVTGMEAAAKLITGSANCSTQVDLLGSQVPQIVNTTLALSIMV